MLMEDLLFDDTETINYIWERLEDSEKKCINKSLIQDILDYILDFYEEKGYLEGDDDDEIAIPEEELFQFIKEKLKLSGDTITEDLLEKVLDLEYQFSEENGVF